MKKTLEEHVTNMTEACSGLEFIRRSLEKEDRYGEAFLLAQIKKVFSDGVCKIEMIESQTPPLKIIKPNKKTKHENNDLL